MSKMKNLSDHFSRVADLIQTQQRRQVLTLNRSRYLNSCTNVIDRFELVIPRLILVRPWEYLKGSILSHFFWNNSIYFEQIVFYILQFPELGDEQITLDSRDDEAQVKQTHVTVCDINPAMLEVGRRRAQELGHQGQTRSNAFCLCNKDCAKPLAAKFM